VFQLDLAESIGVQAYSRPGQAGAQPDRLKNAAHFIFWLPYTLGAMGGMILVRLNGGQTKLDCLTVLHELETSKPSRCAHSLRIKSRENYGNQQYFTCVCMRRDRLSILIKVFLGPFDRSCFEEQKPPFLS
jgi:hypothetical protein